MCYKYVNNVKFFDSYSIRQIAVIDMLFVLTGCIQSGKMCVNEGCFTASHDVRKCLQVGLSNAFYALQCMEQCLLALGSNTLDIVQFAMQCMLGALVAMEADGEAVYLVLDACEGMEKFAFHIDSDGLDGVTI